MSQFIPLVFISSFLSCTLQPLTSLAILVFQYAKSLGLCLADLCGLAQPAFYPRVQLQGPPIGIYKIDSSLASCAKMDMEIVDGREVGRRSFGRTYFHHTKFICQRIGVEDDYYYGIGKCRFADATPDHIRALRLVKIPNHLIFPRYEEGLTIAPDPLPHNVYIKSPRLIEFGDSESSSNLGLHLLHEAKICERLKSNPHPNIAQYHGCIVRDGLIRGLCFKRYPLNLEQRVAEPTPLSIHQCVKLVKRGVKHMHTMNLAHNNIRPGNVMMDGDTPIVIDFTSTLDYGASLAGWRAGAPPWIPPEAKRSSDYNDYYAALQLYHWLREVRT